MPLLDRNDLRVLGNKLDDARRAASCNDAQTKAKGAYCMQPGHPKTKDTEAVINNPPAAVRRGEPETITRKILHGRAFLVICTACKKVYCGLCAQECDCGGGA